MSVRGAPAAILSGCSAVRIVFFFPLTQGCVRVRVCMCVLPASDIPRMHGALPTSKPLLRCAACLCVCCASVCLCQEQGNALGLAHLRAASIRRDARIVAAEQRETTAGVRRKSSAVWDPTAASPHRSSSSAAGTPTPSPSMSGADSTPTPSPSLSNNRTRRAPGKGGSGSAGPSSAASPITLLMSRKQFRSTSPPDSRPTSDL